MVITTTRKTPATTLHRHLPEVMYRRGGLGETTVLSPNLMVPIQGTIAVDGRRFEFTGDPQWALDMPPALPLRLVPGQSQEMAIRYVADDEQDDSDDTAGAHFADPFGCCDGQRNDPDCRRFRPSGRKRSTTARMPLIFSSESPI